MSGEKGLCVGEEHHMYMDGRGGKCSVTIRLVCKLVSVLNGVE